MDAEEYVEAVLSLVERIPPGRVMSYGAIAEVLAPVAGRSSPRRVGTIMAQYGGAVPWHRVVAADGRLVPGHEVRARRLHAEEGTPMRGDKVDMRAAAWYPEAG
jgi:methylated-DNA-protein-cysteine methyltransferase related protein